MLRVLRFSVLLSFCILGTSTPAQVRTAFADEFETFDAGWQKINAGNMYADVRHGKLLIRKPSGFEPFKLLRQVVVDPAKDFKIEMPLEITEAEGTGQIGIVFGGGEPLEHFAFLLSAKDSAGLYKYTGGGREVIGKAKYVGKVDSSGIRLIEVAKIGDVVGCYIDGVNAGYLDLPYNPLYGNTVGILVTKGMNADIPSYKMLERPPRTIRVVAGGEDQVRKNNLGAHINSAASDLAPVISADGRTLYFARSNHEENVAPINNTDIWYSVLDANDEWMPARHFGAPLNNAAANFVISTSPDGNSLLVANTYNADGSFGGGLSLTRRTAKGWSIPKTQKITNFYNLHEFGEYSLSPDGKVIVMAIERDDTHGSKDLYVSFRDAKGNWSEPLNMGDVVNTIGNEIGPFIAADGMTLYYSSNGLPGYGNHDIFIARRLDSSWLQWSPPENLGPFINGRDYDAYYTVTARGDYAYLVSTDGTSFGIEDIYRVKLPQAARPKPVILVSGKVLNAVTRAPVDAEVFYEYLPSGLEAGIAWSNPTDGSYKISLPVGSDFGFRAEAKGFYAVSEQLSTRELKEYTEITKDLLLAPIEAGEAIRLNNIFFDFGLAELRPESFPELLRLVRFLNENPTFAIELGGHTDNIGNDEANQLLSEKRVTAVREYLVDHGIQPTRIKAVGHGKKHPVASNDTEEGRQRNRRVEFRILK